MKHKSFALCAILISLTLSMFIVQGIAADSYSGSVGIVIESNTKTFSTYLSAGAMAVQPNTTISLDESDILIENEYVEGKSINLTGEYFYGGAYKYTIIVEDDTESNAGYVSVSALKNYATSFTTNSDCYIDKVDLYLASPNGQATIALYLATSNWNATGNRSAVGTVEEISIGTCVIAESNECNWYTVDLTDTFLDNSNTDNNTWFIVYKFSAGQDSRWYFVNDGNDDSQCYVEDIFEPGYNLYYNTQGGKYSVDFFTRVQFIEYTENNPPTEVPMLGATNNFYLDFVTPDGLLMGFVNKTAFESTTMEIPDITLIQKLYSDSPKNTIFNFSASLAYGTHTNVNKSGIAYPLVHQGYNFTSICEYFNYSYVMLDSLHSLPNATGHKTFENRLMNLYFSTPTKLKVQYTEWNDSLDGTMYIKVYNSLGALIGYNPVGYLEYSMDLIQMARNPSVNESIVMDMKFAAQYYSWHGSEEDEIEIILGGLTSPLLYTRILNMGEYGISDFMNYTTSHSQDKLYSNQGLITPNTETFENAINFTLNFESHNGFFDIYFIIYGLRLHPVLGLIGVLNLERFSNEIGFHNYLNESVADFSNCFVNFTQYIDPETFYPVFPTQYTMDFEFNSTYYYLDDSFMSLIDHISGTYNFTHTLTLNSINSFQTIEGVTFLRCRNTYEQPDGWAITARKANASDSDYFQTITYPATGGIVERTFTGYSYDFVLIEGPEEPEDPEDPEDPENPEDPEEPETPTLPTLGSLYDSLMNISPFTKMLVLFGIIWYFCFFKQGKSITEIWKPKKK